MTGKRRDNFRIRISEKKLRLIIRCFAVDCSATQTGKIVHANRNTANRYYEFFRDLIVKDGLKERYELNIVNGIEADESYFGPRRVRGKRGRGASKKVIVFGLLKRHGRVYTEVIPTAKQIEILPIIRKTVATGADIYTDGWRSYDALAVYGYNHKKVKHHTDEFVRGDTHINGIESFWSWTKHRLNKFHGVHKRHFKRYLLESEWRFKHRDDMENLLKLLIKQDR